MGSVREACWNTFHLECRDDGIYGSGAAYGIALFHGKHVSKAHPTTSVCRLITGILGLRRWGIFTRRLESTLVQLESLTLPSDTKCKLSRKAVSRSWLLSRNLLGRFRCLTPEVTVS